MRSRSLYVQLLKYRSIIEIYNFVNRYLISDTILILKEKMQNLLYEIEIKNENFRISKLK